MAVFPIRVRAVTQLPGTTLRDPDIERFILLEVEVLCDLLRGFDGDGMLFGTTSEDDGDPQPTHAALLSKRRQLMSVFSTMSRSACSV